MIHGLTPFSHSPPGDPCRRTNCGLGHRHRSKRDGFASSDRPRKGQRGHCVTHNQCMIKGFDRIYHVNDGRVSNG